MECEGKNRGRRGKTLKKLESIRERDVRSGKKGMLVQEINQRSTKGLRVELPKIVIEQKIKKLC